MKKIWGWVVGVVIIVVVAGYAIFYNGNSSSGVADTNGTPNTTPTGDNGGTPSSSTTTGSNASGTGTGNGGNGSNGNGGGTATGQYKDGTYTGPVTDAIYGQLQVVVTIQNGKIVDTECPIQPNAPGHTAEVNQSALPQLKQEAIASQSANVNVISGATQTSQAYQQSLAAALAQAKA